MKRSEFEVNTWAGAAQEKMLAASFLRSSHNINGLGLLHIG